MTQDKDKKDPSDESVAFVSDPYQMGNDDISAAQQSDEELDLDEDFDDVPEAEIESQLQGIANAVREQDKETEKELIDQAGVHEQSMQEELETQIAEDQALAQAEAEMENEEAEDELAEEVRAALPQQDENGDLDVMEVQSCLETLLFLSDKPVSLKKLRDHLGPDFPPALFKKALEEMQERYEQPHHGIYLAEVAGGYQLRTKPGRSALAHKLAKVQKQKLSRGAMETLSIIAYKQPAMKDDIDQIRGVDSSHFIRNLIDKRLVSISGRSELPGRPMLYSTTNEFLEIFGLKDLDALPPLEELEKMIPALEAQKGEAKDPRALEIQKLVSKMKTESDQMSYDPKEDELFLQEIRDRVKQIPMTTATLEAMDNPQPEEEKEEESVETAAETASLESSAPESQEEGTSDSEPTESTTETSPAEHPTVDQAVAEAAQSPLLDQLKD